MPVLSKYKRRKVCAVLLCSLLKELDDETDLFIHRKCRLRNKTSNIFTNREREGAFKLLITKHLLDDETKFKAYFRFTREQFYMLVSFVEEDLKSQPCNRVKRPVSPAEKVALTLRYLATGESYKSLAFSYRISSSYISVTIPKVLLALREKLVPLHLPHPHELDWVKIADDFWDRWSFPNVVGAIDGKHVRIVAPGNSGSLYYNYKHYFSIALLALVDANYKFLAVDVGSYGKEGDAGIFKKSKMGKFIDNGDVTFPPPQYLPNSNILLPHVVLGYEAFRLDKHLMKPFCKKEALLDQEKRNFNYNLCKVRRVSENCFGIMCNTFRIFFTPINAKPETVDLITIVSCCLHNLLRDEYISKNNSLDTQDITYDLPVHNMIPLAGRGGFAKAEGFKVRSRFVEYFKNKSVGRY